MSSTQPGWKTIKNQLEIVNRDPKDLIPYPRNAKLHPPEQVQEIAASIKEFGFNDPVAIDENGEIIEGEGRYHASLLLGLKSIPTIQLLGLSDEQKIAYRLAHNNLNLKTGLDDTLVKADLEILKEFNYDLKLTGFDKGNLSKFLGENFNLDSILNVPTLESQENNHVKTTIDKDPEKDNANTEALLEEVVNNKIESRVKLGEIWQLGRHRIACGDSTIEKNIKALLGNKFGDVGMVWADPPYGIKHSGKGIKGNADSNDFGEILNDRDVEVAKNNFNLCNALFGNSRLIYWGANYYPSVLANGFGWVIWDKEREGETFSGAELAFVNKGIRLDIFRHQWHGMIKASERGEKRVHPTQKPVALCEWVFNKYGQSADIILDPFLGSAPSIIAAQKMEGNRTVYGFELSPDYCEVIIQRFEKFAGIKAKLVGHLP